VVPSGQGVGNGALYDGTGLVDARAVGRSRGRGRKVQEGVEGGVLMVGFFFCGWGAAVHGRCVLCVRSCASAVPFYALLIWIVPYHRYELRFL
jgi:hypothetical protein